MGHEKSRLPLGPIIALLVLALATTLFFLLFEIKPAPPEEKLSPKAQDNQVLALQRWLEAENKEVHDRRAFTGKALLEFEANHFIVDANSLDPQGLMLDDLLARARQGDVLMLHSLKTGMLSEINLSLFNETGARIVTEDDIPVDRIGAGERLGQNDYGRDNTVLHFDSNLQIDSDGDHIAWRVWEDENSIPRMAEFPLGQGRIILCGKPVFMHNLFLGMEKNALLTWDVIGDGERYLFIRGAPPRPTLFGSLFDRGNPAYFLAALTLLVISAFWMQLAPFGRALPDPDENEGPSFARWIHEGRFLRRYGALDSLIAPWRRHLARRFMATADGLPTREALGKAAKDSGIPTDSLVDLFYGSPTESMRQFRRRMHTIHVLVEKL